MRLEDTVIASVDDHAIEPPEAFIRHYPASKRDAAPCIVDNNGKEAWLWCGRTYPTVGLNAVVGRPKSEYDMEPTRCSLLRKGTFDLKARSDDMNIDGIPASLNFPTMPDAAGGNFFDATERSEALLAIRAWHDWYVLE